MTNPHINKLAMYLVVITVLDRFSAVVATIPAFVELVAAFKKLVADINASSQVVDKGTSGETKAKWKAEDDMSDTVSALVGSLHSYATEKDDQELMQKSDVGGFGHRPQTRRPKGGVLYFACRSGGSSQGRPGRLGCDRR